MSQEIEAKLEVLSAMNTTLGKLTNVQIRLSLAGEDALAEQMDTKRKDLLREIETLQERVAEQWTVNAETITDNLRIANRKVQVRIRRIQNRVNVAENAINIIGHIDKAIDFAKKVVV